MKQKPSVNLRTIASLALLVILFAACTAAPGDEPIVGSEATATPTQSPDDPVNSEDPTAIPTPDSAGEEMLIQDAVITGVQIMMMESWPLQASVQIDGELGDGCTELGPITTERDGETFTVTVKTTRPADAVCTMELRFFSETVALDIEGLEAGTYTVDVNGVTETFTLDQDNVMQPETEEPGDDVSLSDEDRAELIRLTLERALIEQEIPDYGLLEDPANVVLSTENIDAALVPELPGVSLELLTPDEIQARADEQGDFLYLRFDRLEADSAEEVSVSLSNSWAVGADSDNVYLSGGGFTIEYTKTGESWTGEVTETWIS